MSAGKHPRYRGWPRRKLEANFVLPGDSPEGRIEKLPNLWIGGYEQLKGDWLTFQPGREKLAFEKRLCVVCGEKMEGLRVFGKYQSRSPEGRITDGPAGHPRCIMVATATCPHFRKASQAEDAGVAFVYDGEGSGLLGNDGQQTRYKESITSQAEVVHEAKLLTRAELRVLAREKPLG